jgi:hypothetical protein
MEIAVTQLRMTLLGPLLAALLALQAGAQQTAGSAPEGLGADRPGIGVGADVVPPGAFQIEAGISLGSGRDGPTTTRVFIGGSPLFRLGLVGRLEVRFDGDGFRRESSRTGGRQRETVQGLSDFEAGLKIGVVAEGRVRPEVAVLPSLTLPVGVDGLSAGAANPSLVLAWSKNLSRSFTVGGNFAFASIKDSEGHFLRPAQSLVVGFPIVRRLGGYAEVYRLSSAARGAPANWTFDAGLTLPLGGNAQLDVEGGRTLHSATPSWFCGMGVVYRVRRRPGI